MISSYPKIYNLGHKAIRELFCDPVVCEEKVDGSQVSMGIINGQLCVRSKSVQLDVHNPDGMFKLAVEAAARLPLREDWVYRGEYLAKPKHNTLAYTRVPAHNIIIYDIQNGPESYLTRTEKEAEASRLGLEIVPVFYVGKIDSFEAFQSLLEHTSILGGQRVEGVVIKNYHRFGVDGKALMGKHVSEAFKEIHRYEWKDKNPGQNDILTKLAFAYKTPARWAKAIQHLAERGELENSPTDIGKLIKEIQGDTMAECGDEIREALFQWAAPALRRAIVGGFPEWYKQQLVSKQFSFDSDPAGNPPCVDGVSACTPAESAKAASLTEMVGRPRGFNSLTAEGAAIAFENGEE